MSYRILVAAPEASAGAPLVQRLGSEGYQVESVRETAVDSKKPPPDLLVLDSALLDRGGRAMLERFRTLSPEFTAILLQGPLPPDSPRNPVPLDVEEVLAKPVDVEELVRAVRQLSESAGLREEARQKYGLAG